MPKTGETDSLDDYAPVAERIALFYQRFPLGRVITRLVERSDDVVIVQAAVFRSPNERRPSATGWAAERPGDGEINTVACLENTETSAIGRALANLGLGGSRRSRGSESTDESATSPDSLGVQTIYEQPRFWPARVRARARSQVLYQPVGDPTGLPRAPSLIVQDLIRLLHEAERYGMRPGRAAEYRRRIERDHCPDAKLERLERALRHWVSAARDRAP
jgi:hypothetical protein